MLHWLLQKKQLSSNITKTAADLIKKDVIVLSDYVMGVDVGGTKILVGFVKRDGGIVVQKRYPMNRSSFDLALDSIFFACQDFLYENMYLPKPLAVGFGLVGRCDPKNGIWTSAVNIPITSAVNLRSEMDQRHGLKAFLDNDVFCQTTAELLYGAGKVYDDFILVNIGTGLSMGIVSGGNLVRGSGNVAGEVGQIKTGHGTSTLEEISSGGGQALRAKREAKKYSSSLAHYADELINPGAIFEEAKNGDKLANMIYEDAASAICQTMANLVSIFNPAAVIFAGSVIKTPGLLERISDYIHKNAYFSSLKDLKEICLTKLDVDIVGLIGAASVAWMGLEKIEEVDFV